jgi:hypothetical protein
MRGALRTSRTRGGMRWTRRLRTTNASWSRTAKSCGPGAAVLASSFAKISRSDGGKKAVHRGEPEVSRKPSRRESRVVPAHLWSFPLCIAHNARHRGPRVPAGTRLSLRPPRFGRVIGFAKTRTLDAARVRRCGQSMSRQPTPGRSREPPLPTARKTNKRGETARVSQAARTTGSAAQGRYSCTSSPSPWTYQSARDDQ